MFNDDNSFAHMLMIVLISIMFVCVIADSFQVYKQNKTIQTIERRQKNIERQMNFFNLLANNTIKQNRIMYLLKKMREKQEKNKKILGGIKNASRK